MRWALNLKIRFKLLFAFGLTALISGVVGYIGIDSLKTIGKNDIELYEQMTVPLQSISEMASAFQIMRVAARDLVLANEPDELKERLNEFNNCKSDLKRSAVKFGEVNNESGAVASALDSFNEALKAYNVYLEDLIAMAQKNQDAEALKLLNGDLAQAATNVQDALEYLIQLKMNAARTKSSSNQTMSDQATRMMTLVVLINVLVAIGLGLLISRTVSKPVRKLAELANKLAVGDVNVSIQVTSKDEIGQLARSFERMIANIRAQANLAERIAKGDLTATVTLKSEQDILSRSLQQVVTTLRDLVAESALLTRSALEGKLETRGDLAKFEGGYREIIKGVNQTLDAVTEPVRYAIDYLNRMANGEYVEPITKTYSGEYQVLMNSLTVIRITLENLLSETTELTRAAAAGQLEIRGDLKKFKGWYADIVAGINRTIDTFLQPLNEASAVFSRMAVNDFTLEMHGNYQGVLSHFAVAINQVRERLLGIEEAFLLIAHGDLSSLEKLQQSGKLSENDQLVPAMIKMGEVLKELIDETNRLSQAAVNGDLSVRGNVDKFEGGYRAIVAGFNSTLDAINEPIVEALQVLQELVQGNLQVKMNGEYQGDHAALKAGMNQAIDSFDEVLREIYQVSQQVAVGSRQVSNSSVTLSQGASEQAGTMEEISASIAEIASQTQQNAANANQASDLARNAKTQAVEGSQQMNAMLNAMNAINESSINISKIIKVIDEIAFQTNILALNAAVEAARAGQYGKGFAVVAEEVRNLAARSATAAKETTEMIDGSIKKVELGSKIARDTAAALNTIVNSVTRTTDLMEQIAAASNEQATAISQINQGVAQVSKVTQNATAIAEESAAASEELANQAKQLEEMVAKFKISDSQTEKGLSNTGELTASPPAPAAIATKVSPTLAETGIKLDDDEFDKY